MTDTLQRLTAALEQAELTAGATLAQQRYRVHAVAFDMPILMIPLAGTKRVHAAGKSWSCAAGQFLMVHQAGRGDVENVPPDDAPYRAWVLPFPWDVIELARGLLAGRVCENEALAGVGELSDLEEALLAWIADVDTDDATLRNYRLLGVLLALFNAGHCAFVLARDPSLSARIRLAVSSDPSRDWVSAHFEQMFYLSGATLRRRLAAEGTSLRELVREARLHAALFQLQTTRTPLKAVAQACGYRSLASFRSNFIDRFGLEPTAVAQP